jgi:hypothetical protein
LTPHSLRTTASSFSLNIDKSTSVPVLLADIPANQLPLPLSTGNNGPPAKFYGQESVSALVNTLRTVGPSSKVIVNPDSTDEQKEQFALFRERSNAGVVSELWKAETNALTTFHSSLWWLVLKYLHFVPLARLSPASDSIFHQRLLGLRAISL